MANEDDVRPWDRQPGETSKAYAAFVTYRDLGADRSVRLVSEALAKTQTVIKRWSSAHNWVSRVEAWDSMPGRAVEGAYKEMAERIAAQHEDLATALMSKLRKNVDLLKDGKDPTVSFSTALSAARQSHQFATDLTKPQSTKTDEITKAIENLLNKLAGE